MESNTVEYSHFSREIIIETNSLGIITYITHNCSSILRNGQSAFLNTHIGNYIKLNFNTTIVNYSFKCQFTIKNGCEIYFDVLVSPKINSKSQSIGFILSLIPIGKHEQMEVKDLKFNKLFNNTKDIIFKMQFIPEIKFTYLSSSIESIFGYSLNDYMKNPMLPFETVHPDDYAIQLSKGNKETDFSGFFQVRFKHKNEYYIWTETHIIPTFNDNAELVAIEGISRDITKRIELEEKLEKLSYVDGLTGLYNRTYLNKQIGILSYDVDIPLAIIACDLDNLKYYNDNFGHCKGDILLKTVGSFLIKTFMKDSVVIRNGGDEFIIILTGCSQEKSESTY